MNKPHVEVVLINWKRPANVARIVEALRGQSQPCTVTICDCHPEPEFALPERTLECVDRVYRWTHNLGAYSRYVPSAGYDHEFTYLADDDMVPGNRCIEHFLDYAYGEPFGVLGQVGRWLKPDGVYRTGKVARTRCMEEVDMVVRAYFVRTKNLMFLPSMRWELGLQGATDAEDDILLAVAMQLKGNLGSYITPQSTDEETSVIKEKLPSPHALSDRPDHLHQRTELFRKAAALGWRPYSDRSGPRILHTLRQWAS